MAENATNVTIPVEQFQQINSKLAQLEATAAQAEAARQSEEQPASPEEER